LEFSTLALRTDLISKSTRIKLRKSLKLYLEALKNSYKLVLGLSITIISLAIAVNLPIINTGVIETDCGPQIPESCSTQTIYRSIALEYCWYGCLVVEGVPTVTLEYATLYSGAASSVTRRGTAFLVIGLNNPGSATKVISFNIPDSNITVYQCPSLTSCVAPATTTVAAKSITGFNTSATEFYFSTKIISNETYNYVIAFSDGQSISGTLRAK
jgi:hypothetical protein